MKTKTYFSLLAGVGLLALAASPSAHAQLTIMDQIGTTGSFFTGDNATASENFSDFPTYSIATVDDFTVSTPAAITNVSAAMLGFGGFTSFSLLTGYDVNIYSSVAKANSSLTGDVFHMTIPSALATVTTPFSGDAESGLVSLPVVIPLTAAGTYYISVIADGSFATDGEVGVYASTGLTGSTPGGANAFQENPGGGFGLTDPSALGTDAAYRITGVPEPGTWAMMLAGLGALVGVQRYRRCAS